MPQCISAVVSWKSATALTTKWSRPRDPASKTSSRAAWLPQPPKKAKSNWTTLLASLEELLADYRDSSRGLRLWDKNSREAMFVRRLGRRPDESYEIYTTYLETRAPEVVANIVICLIHQTNYLLDQLLRQLEQAFLKEGACASA